MGKRRRRRREEEPRRPRPQAPPWRGAWGPAPRRGPAVADPLGRGEGGAEEELGRL